MVSERMVSTPQGEARLVIRRARSPVATLVLTHGAGGGIEAPDLVRLARSLPTHDVSTTLVEMPWRVQGRRLAPPPSTIDACYTAALDAMRSRAPLVLGGRSAGARSACRIARDAGARAVVALAFPLHPPGKPESSRAEELRGTRLPLLVVQGERDPFGRPEEFPDGLDLVPVPEADHGFAVGKRAALSRDDALDIVLEATLEWLVRELGGNPAR